jgi:hypothetical protein
MYVSNILYTETINSIKHFRVHPQGFSIGEDITVDADRLMKVTEEAKRIKVQIESLDEGGAYFPNQKSDSIIVTPVTYLPSEEVFVFSASELYDAKIIASRKDNASVLYNVHYKGWKSRHDEWVKGNEIFKKTSISGEIKLKLKKYKNSPIRIPKENIGINRKKNYKRKSKIDNEMYVLTEIKNKKNESGNANSYTVARAKGGLKSDTTEGQLIAGDNQESIIIRSMIKQNDMENKENVVKIEELGKENAKLKPIAVYLCCQQCKKPRPAN